MVQNLDLKQLQRKAWMSYFEDGLWDISMGLWMLTVAVLLLTGNVWSTFMLLAAVLVMSVGKKLITTPRIGRVKFGSRRGVKHKKVMAVVGISVFALVWLLLALLRLHLPEVVLAPLFGICFALVFGLIAHYMDFGRLYAYGLLLAISLALIEALDNAVGPTALALSGCIPLLIGLVMLVRFLWKYPKPVEEALDGTA